MIKEASRTKDFEGKEADFHYGSEEISSLGSQARQMAVLYRLNRSSETYKEGPESSHVEIVSIGLSRVEQGSKGIDLNPLDIEFSASNRNYGNIHEKVTRGSWENMGISRSGLLGLLRETLPDYVCNIIPQQ